MPAFAQSVFECPEPEPEDNTISTLFKQFEFVIIESLITSFGLDFIVKDQHGGDVDTVHNVRKIGEDPDMKYKNADNKKAYESRGEYNSAEYHRDENFVAKRSEINARKSSGTLVDEYTGAKISAGERSDLDHVISAKEIHDDRGRVLAGLSGSELANSDENLAATSPHTNRSKQADTMEEYIDKHGGEYTDEQKQLMRERDKTARKATDKKIAQSYYTSPEFAKDTALAAGKLGAAMGLKQALGFMFANIWFSVKEEFQKAEFSSKLDLGEFFTAIGNGVKNGIAKTNGNVILKKANEGAAAGALASITTTIANIFFTTAKNVVKIIRMTWTSIVQAAEVLFINPECYSLGDQLQAAAKILATGASIVLGSVVSELIGKTPVGQIPVIGEIVNTFCGSLVSGILSCVLLFALDKQSDAKKLIVYLNSIDTFDKSAANIKRTADEFESYAARIMKIDIDKFRLETDAFNKCVSEIDNYSDEREFNRELYNIYNIIDVRIPWAGYERFDDFMSDKNSRLVIG